MKQNEETKVDKRIRRELLDIVREITTDEDKQERLMKHLWLLDNVWCLRVAKKVKSYWLKGKPPDVGFSLVAQRMFEGAVRILGADPPSRPPNPL